MNGNREGILKFQLKII